MALARAHVRIEGRVQGVCFRLYTERQAREHRLSGWVRNRRDGSVEAVFEGEEADVAEVVEWCRHGPPAAFVSNVKVDWEPASGQHSSFDIRYTE